jgi:hypothetical protein
MRIRFDRLIACVRDDVGKTALQAATFTAKIFGLKAFDVALVFYTWRFRTPFAPVLVLGAAVAPL